MLELLQGSWICLELKVEGSRALESSELVEKVALAAMQPKGPPLPPLLSPMSEARWWAGYANHSEHKAYALACYDALPSKDQMAFRRHISEVEIAA